MRLKLVTFMFLLHWLIREELVHIKHGEEQKRKFYRALCVLNAPVTVDIMQKLQIPDGFLVQQQTPLRVLHRRPLLTRPRQIYSVKGYVHKGEIFDLTTLSVKSS